LAENVICPTLILAECSAAIARQTGDPVLAQNLVILIEQFPRLQLIALDLPLAQHAAQPTATHRLRGADAVYVALAQTANAMLVTWNTEMLARGKAVTSVQTPTDWLATHSDA
jgi:predicted nucleic acid-binding protein